MGSDFVSIIEAAKLLQCTGRSVTAYLHTGLLRRVKLGNATRIPLEDVLQLRDERGAGLPPMNRKTFHQLMARIERLEMSVTVLKKATGFTDLPMRPSPEEAAGLFKMAERAYGEKQWVLEEIGMWADMFERMDEVFFDAVSAAVSGEGWRPFYNLCAAQAKQLAYDERFHSSLPLQQLHDRLCAALKTIRGVILAWIEAGNGTAVDQALPEEALLRRLPAKEPAPLG